MERTVPTLEKVSGITGRVLCAIGIITLSVMALLITADITGRYLFNSPILGTFELVEVLNVVVVFCGLAYTTTVRGHIAVEVFALQLSPRVRTVIDIATSFLVLGVSSVLVYATTDVGVRIWQHGDVTLLLKIPIFPFRFIISLGVLAMCLVLLAQWLGTLGQRRKEG